MTTRLQQIEDRERKATKGPWSWESVAEKSNEFVVGIAIDKNDVPICGEIPKGYDEDLDAFMDEKIIRLSEIGANEAGQANFCDADFIAHSRADIPMLLDLVKRAREILIIALQNANSQVELRDLVIKAEKWLEDCEK